MRLLVVEDSRRLRESLADGLRAAGYAVDAAADGRQGLIHARTTDYDAVVLDLNLPELDGITLLRRLREDGREPDPGGARSRGATPVIILSARDRVEQRVEGLRAGADDYLVKPFAFDELLARLEALCRRSRGLPAATRRIGSVELDLGARRFTVGGREVPLPPREYAVLEFLFLSAGRVVSRAELEEHVYPEDRQVWSNAVDSAVASIRRRLHDAGVADLIQTRRGRGYLVGSPHSAEPPPRAAPVSEGEPARAAREERA